MNFFNPDTPAYRCAKHGEISISQTIFVSLDETNRDIFCMLCVLDWLRSNSGTVTEIKGVKP